MIGAKLACNQPLTNQFCAGYQQRQHHDMYRHASVTPPTRAHLHPLHQVSISTSPSFSVLQCAIEAPSLIYHVGRHLQLGLFALARAEQATLARFQQHAKPTELGVWPALAA
jgi:hypothetical protein